MADHAVGKEVEGICEVTYDDANFSVDKEQFDRFLSALDKPARDIPALRKLFIEPGVFDDE